MTQIWTDPTKTTSVIQGTFRISRDPGENLVTILGSCVAMCLFDPSAQIGGMNHFLLPFGPDAAADASAVAGGDRSLRYGVHAMELLINGLLQQGARKSTLVAKLFGGARISPSLRDIGQTNADFALEFLATESIPCIAQSLGGRAARRVMFRPATGAVRVLQVPPSDFSDEPLVAMPAPPKPKADITLF